ncbi:unnamed protein product [Candida verbasci]|uniref:Protein CASP n=1 Tax=Candida verbasci TaxID=1227364 RepID=A0A9W4TVS9_9ASCO|nr:unnamed protein product [Candida verbasci]
MSEEDNNNIKNTTQSSNLYTNVLQTWTEIDLPNLQKKLDEQGISIKEDQKASLLSRKNLATKTKEFKKLEDDEKINQLNKLLKLYQNEIDSLTNKNKSIESYFFGIYRLISEAPDPKPIIEMSLDSIIEMKNVQNLKNEINKLNEELINKADYEQLKQKLIQKENKLVTLSKSNSLLEEKEDDWSQKLQSANATILKLKKELDEARTTVEINKLQLNNQNSTADNSNSSPIILSRDIEFTKKRIFELEKKNEDLKIELSKSKNDNEIEIVKNDCFNKISEIESENSILIANLNQVRSKAKQESQEHSIKIESFNREISSMQQEISNLKKKLDSTSDYEEIKNELTLLRQIEFGEETNNNIDSVIINKNKQLTQELANYRSQHNDLNEKITQLTQQLESTNQELNNLRQLNEKLENDMADIQDVSHNNNRFSDNASIISNFTKITRLTRNGSLASLENNTKEDSNSILPIITKQRDRFREKNNELEEELRKQFNQINDFKRQINKLKKDNEELYERSRYLASIQTPGTRNLTTNAATGRKLLYPKPNSYDTDLENPYQKNYESKLHPIEQFRIKEQERISSRLSPIERLFISMTRAVLATRTTRMLFFGYCLGLHIIVMFVTIYSMSLHTSAIPEVGLNTSTGGAATNLAGSPDSLGKVIQPN